MGNRLQSVVLCGLGALAGCQQKGVPITEVEDGMNVVADAGMDDMVVQVDAAVIDASAQDEVCPTFEFEGCDDDTRASVRGFCEDVYDSLIAACGEIAPADMWSRVQESGLCARKAIAFEFACQFEDYVSLELRQFVQTLMNSDDPAIDEASLRLILEEEGFVQDDEWDDVYHRDNIRVSWWVSSLTLDVDAVPTLFYEFGDNSYIIMGYSTNYQRGTFSCNPENDGVEVAVNHRRNCAGEEGASSFRYYNGDSEGGTCEWDERVCE